MESLVDKDACTRVGKQSGKRIESIRGTTPRLTQPAAVVVLNVNDEAPDPSSWIAPKPDWATTFKLATKNTPTHPVARHLRQLRHPQTPQQPDLARQ
ncbi:hypothetical protein ABFA25_02960 [Mycobacterium lepromatosis]|uniref:hypothetical protein n=1 Tax=Mycobacterium lepromatosis TaxID=480418 RepID=UPI003D804650